MAQVVEKWNPYARVRQDLFGAIDIVAIKPGLMTLGVQTTTAGNMSARVQKLNDLETVRVLKQTGHWKVIVHGWRRPTKRRRQWTLREQEL